MKSNEKLKVLSLFSGAGGLDVGLEKIGKYELLACVELEPDFCKTLEKNKENGLFGSKDTMIIQKDISKLDPEDLMRTIGVGPGEVDVVIGGPPCQSFSTAGKRESIADIRGQLIFKFLKFVEAFRPQYFVMENVRGLLSSRIKHVPIAKRKTGQKVSPDEKPGSVLDKWVEDLRLIGNGEYRVDIFEVNAVNYGAPQLRERVFFIGNREGKNIVFPQPTHGPGTSNDFSTLGDALNDFHEDEIEVMDFSPRKKRYLSMIPPGGNWRYLPDEIAQESMGRAYYAKGGRSGWWRRLSWDLPCPTITTLPNHSSTSMCHPEEIRALSVGEFARIQGFPDGWEFFGTVMQKMKQVGNAVPIRLGEVVGEVIFISMEKDNVIGRAELPPVTRNYIKSHVRTRSWWKDGKAVVRSSSVPETGESTKVDIIEDELTLF